MPDTLTPLPATSGAAQGAPAVTSGTWTPLNDQPLAHNPTFYPAGVFLLTDGTVLAQDGALTNQGWWKLTPDNTGSYVNGSWSQVASPPNCPNNYPGASADTVYSPLYYASAVLPDGRFVMIGGEYNYNYDYVKNDHSREVWTSQGAIYDPVANNWTCIAPPSGWTEIGDAQSVVLPDGTFMVAHPQDDQVATLNVDTNPPTFNPPFTPPGKTGDMTSNITCFGVSGACNDEEGWLLLPDGNVLTLEVWNANDGSDTPALTYNPLTSAWSGAGSAPDPLVLIKKGNNFFFEIGPSVLRPDGTVFATGAAGFNDIYNPGNGAWSRGPSFPTISVTYSAGSCNLSNATEQLSEADAPAVLLPDGNVLIAPGPVDATCQWIPPTEFFEFDGTSLTQVADAVNGSKVPSYKGRLLLLPTGQVMYTNTFNYVQLYTPAGSPNPSWTPIVSSSPSNVTPGGTDYQLSGTQFNGL